MFGRLFRRQHPPAPEPQPAPSLQRPPSRSALVADEPPAAPPGRAAQRTPAAPPPAATDAPRPPATNAPATDAPRATVSLSVTVLLPRVPWPVEAPLDNPALAALASAGRLEVLSALAMSARFAFAGHAIQTMWLDFPYPLAAEALATSPLFADRDAVAAHRAHLVAFTETEDTTPARARAGLALSAFAGHLAPAALLWPDAGVLSGAARLARIETEAAGGRMPVDCWFGLRPVRSDGPTPGVAVTGARIFLPFDVVIRPLADQDTATKLSLFFTTLAWLIDAAPDLVTPAIVDTHTGSRLAVELRDAGADRSWLEITESRVA
jgi:hypothetical protein